MSHPLPTLAQAPEVVGTAVTQSPSAPAPVPVDGFLVLERRSGEDIIISVGDVVIVLRALNIRGGRVRLGLNGPREQATFHRREVWDMIQSERKCDGQSG